MASSKHFTYLSLICMVVVVNEATAQPTFIKEFCQIVHNYTTNSTYEENLNRLLSIMPSNIDAANSGFYNSSYGQNADKVYATGLCRGDVKAEACRSCLNYSANSITERCPNRKEAYDWYDECMLRYSNRSIFATVETDPWYWLSNPQNVSSSEVDDFKQVLMALLGDLKSKAAAGGALRKFATGNKTVNFETIYALLQCTPDLSLAQCTSCLDIATGEIPQCCNGTKGGRVIRQSCNLRYEVYLFYEPDSPTTTPGIGTLPPLTSPPSPTTQDNFSAANKLGQGGFGPVFRGRLNNGQVIAVKRLSRNSGQGELEFKNEVLLVAKLQHRNLVRLLGFCFDGNERLLVYEFVPNASLDHFIFDPMKRANLDWNKQFKIIGGIARGLLYLHEDSRLRIIHRDLKASNILLDEEMNPKISDFGMARLFMVDQTQADTSRIVGTYGYMAPEYAMNGHFSVKSDVYSFGVLLLEIVSGQKNNCFRHREDVEDLLTFAWKNWREGTGSNAVDALMRGGLTSEMMRCIHIALLCVQENANDRPAMNSIVLMLNSNSVTLPVPSRPAFFMHSAIDESSGGTSLGSDHNSRVPASDDQRSKAKSSNFAQASTNKASITDLYSR